MATAFTDLCELQKPVGDVTDALSTILNSRLCEYVTPKGKHICDKVLIGRTDAGTVFGSSF